MIDSVANASAVSADSLTLTKGKREDPAKIREAAGQFEALLLGQMIKISREASSSGWLGTGDDQAGQIGMEVAEQQFAQSLAKSGGFGLAKMIAKGLEDRAKAAATPASETSPGPKRSAGGSV